MPLVQTPPSPVQEPVVSGPDLQLPTESFHAYQSGLKVINSHFPDVSMPENQSEDSNLQFFGHLVPCSRRKGNAERINAGNPLAFVATRLPESSAEISSLTDIFRKELGDPELEVIVSRVHVRECPNLNTHLITTYSKNGQHLGVYFVDIIPASSEQIATASVQVEATTQLQEVHQIFPLTLRQENILTVENDQALGTAFLNVIEIPFRFGNQGLTCTDDIKKQQADPNVQTGFNSFTWVAVEAGAANCNCLIPEIGWRVVRQHTHIDRVVKFANRLERDGR